MSTTNSYDQPLVLVTKIALVLWGIVTVLGGLGLMFVPGFATTVVVPPPLDPIPPFNAGLYGALAISTGAASFYALYRNKWAFAAPVMAMYLVDDIFQQIVAIQRVMQGPVPFQVWFYIIFGVVYFVLIFLSYRQQGSI
jgi:hypothetical protein